MAIGSTVQASPSSTAHTTLHGRLRARDALAIGWRRVIDNLGAWLLLVLLAFVFMGGVYSAIGMTGEPAVPAQGAPTLNWSPSAGGSFLQLVSFVVQLGVSACFLAMGALEVSQPPATIADAFRALKRLPAYYAVYLLQVVVLFMTLVVPLLAVVLLAISASDVASFGRMLGADSMTESLQGMLLFSLEWFVDAKAGLVATMSPGVFGAVAAVSLFVWVAVGLYLLVPVYLAQFEALVGESASPKAAVSNAWKAVRGHRFYALRVMLLTVVALVLSVLLCLIGVVVGIPVVTVASAACYASMREHSVI